MKAASVVLVLILVVGCSPYIYKSEINEFSNGVNNLNVAYSSGLKSLGTERQEKQRWDWAKNKALVSLTEGCVPQATGGPDTTPPCALQANGMALPAPSRTETEAVKAAPIIKALREYADALAAVTNSKDQQDLEEAQAQFKNSIQNLAKQRDTKLTKPDGPISELLFWGHDGSAERASLCHPEGRRNRGQRAGGDARRSDGRYVGGASNGSR